MSKKIDKRHHYFLAVDTETAGPLEAPIVYDLGARVIDSKGRVYEEASYVLYETYCLEKEMMKTAYYATKLPQYERGLRTGDWKMVKTITAFKKLRDWMEKYGITEVLAYNTKFDRKALNNTIRRYTKYHYFFPKETEYLDIWNMACSTLFKRKSFYEIAHRLNWESPAGNVRTNAEVGYAFISGVENFEERHTALEDVKIETALFLACLQARVKNEDKGIIGNPWRKPQPGWNKYKAKKAEND
jgi:hypothetical protein